MTEFNKLDEIASKVIVAFPQKENRVKEEFYTLKKAISDIAFDDIFKPMHEEQSLIEEEEQKEKLRIMNILYKDGLQGLLLDVINKEK